MLSENENTYLAKWLNNDLTAQELEDLKSRPEYQEYKKIVQGMEFFDPPNFDVKDALQTTLEKLDQTQETKVIWLKPLFYTISVAASIILIIGLFFTKVTYTTLPGEQLAIVLPDGSSVDLNASSTLSHQRFFWANNRTVHLNGEAFFQVTSGTNFTVTTPLGNVEVLGTKFNVRHRPDEFKVGCYEGKVRVSSLENQKKILEKGEAVALKDKELVPVKVTNISPLWMQGESLFDTSPLGLVLDEIERQYNITFDRNAVDQNQLFTGGFNHKNLKIALESVLTPMGIEYVINGTKISLYSP